MEAIDFIRREADSDFNMMQLLRRLDALEQETLIFIVDKYAKRELKEKLTEILN